MKTAKKFGGTFDPKKDVWVGIDQSYTGFAVTILDADGGWTTWVYKSEGAGVERLNSIRSFLTSLFVYDFPDLKIIDVAMEGYAFGSQMANMLGELGGLVKLFCYDELNVKPLIVPPTSLKKYVTGKGTGVQKNQILLYVYKKWDVEFTDDNAADSFSLAKIASGLYDLTYEKEVYRKLNDGKHRA
jgi:hypothetical protein